VPAWNARVTVGADEMVKLIEACLPLMLLRIPNPARYGLQLGDQFSPPDRWSAAPSCAPVMFS